MKTVCPYCFRAYALRAAPFRCVNVPEACPHGVDQLLVDAWGEDRLVGHLIPPRWSVVPRSRMECDRCGHESVIRLCPHCHQALPSSAGTLEDRVIAIVGAADAGKSHYIAALVDRLQKVSSGLGFTVTPANELTERRYRRDFSRHLERRRTIPPTESGSSRDAQVRLPLVYKLQPRGSGGEARGVHLVFFDMAGEDTGSVERLNLVSRYLFAASGILLLVDPLQLAGVRSQVDPAQLQEHTPAVRGLLGRCADVVHGGQRRGGRSRVPLAVGITKLDAIEPLLGPWSTLRSHPRTDGGVDLADIYNVDAELRAQLEEWGESWLVNDADGAFERARFFALSSLGGAPVDGALLHEPLPRRVESPVLWILQQSGLVAAREES
jgi:hypothetical protein